MREILFRGKHAESGKWAYGNFIADALEGSNELVSWGFIKYYDKQSMKSVIVEIDRETLGQYTGLKDKNGKKIFEYDIVKMHQFLFDGDEYESELIGTIVYDDVHEQSGGAMACWSLIDIKNADLSKYCGYNEDEEFKESKFALCLFTGLHDESFEVIGNIHDKESI